MIASVEQARGKLANGIPTQSTEVQHGKEVVGKTRPASNPESRMLDDEVFTMKFQDLSKVTGAQAFGRKIVFFAPESNARIKRTRCICASTGTNACRLTQIVQAAAQYMHGILDVTQDNGNISWLV